MKRERLAEVHRRLGEREHGVERRMLDQADHVPDGEAMRESARKISENADRHLAVAHRLDSNDRPNVDPRPAQDPSGDEEQARPPR